MGNKDTDQVDETKSLPQEAVSPELEGQPTAALEDVVVVEDVEGDTRSVPGEAQATSAMEGGEVFVILPEADTGDVPVVETHAVDDTETQNEPAQLAEGETENAGSSLQEIQEELEDEYLTEPAPGISQELSATIAGDMPAEDLELHDGGSGQIESLADRPHRSWLRFALSAAAALLLGAGGALYYFSPAGGGESGGATAHATSGGGQVGLPAPVTDPAGQGNSTSPADLTAEAKEAFRTKVQLAVRLGFGGEKNR